MGKSFFLVIWLHRWSTSLWLYISHPPHPLLYLFSYCPLLNPPFFFLFFLPRNICDPADSYRCRWPHVWQQCSCGLQHSGGPALLLSGCQDWYDCTHAAKPPFWKTPSVTRETSILIIYMKSLMGFKYSPTALAIIWTPYEFVISMNDVRWPDKVDKRTTDSQDLPTVVWQLLLNPHLVSNTESHCNCTVVWL